MPKVSVIIPTQNRPLLLQSAIQSVLNQTFQDFEILVIDDASEDSPEEMVNLIKDKRIKYFRHDVIKGEAGSRNTGIINAKGKFIAFLDDDDEWLPEKLSLQLELLEKGSPKIGVVYTGRQCLNLSDKKIIGITNPSKKGDIYYDMLRENVIGTPSSVLVKKECIEKIGLFDENLAYFVDYDFFLRISKHFLIECIATPLVNYYSHEGNLTSNIQKVENGLISLEKKYCPKNNLENLNYCFYFLQYRDIGARYCMNGNMKNAREAFKKSIKINPFGFKSYYYYIFSLLSYEKFKFLLEIRNKIRTKVKYLICLLP